MYTLNKEISILGCGWYGLELAKKLLEEGYTVKGSTTTPEKFSVLEQSGIIPFLIDFQEKEEHSETVFFDAPVLIICIPPKRSSAEQHLFLSKIERISKAATSGKTEHIIFISSTSVYGDLNGEVDEHTAPEPDTESGKAILAAELLLKAHTSFDTTILRFGGLIGPNRDPGRFFAGKSAIPNGKAPVNLIHLSDCTGITLSILKKEAFGYTYNACSPDHPERAVFYTLATERSGLDSPQFKDELLNWKLVKSITIPAQLNYNFAVPLNSIVSQ